VVESYPSTDIYILLPQITGGLLTAFVYRRGGEQRGGGGGKGRAGRWQSTRGYRVI
jgi:hypothetical protein